MAYSVHQYEHDPSATGYGVAAADRLGLDRDQVFKTLLVALVGSAGPAEAAVAIVPVSAQLALKAVGTALGVKRVEMCDPAVAQRITGYVLGGISPFGQRRRLTTVIDETCLLHDVVYVSGGRRGLDLGVAPGDLIDILDATTAPIAT